MAKIVSEEQKKFNSKIGENLKKCIKKSGKTLRDFAKELGISEPTMFAWANGKQTPDIFYLVKTCKILNINFNSILTGCIENNGLSPEEIGILREIIADRISAKQ